MMTCRINKLIQFKSNQIIKEKNHLTQKICNNINSQKDKRLHQ
jgi:hypothetical protein